jgi:predicted transcriptional regulator
MSDILNVISASDKRRNLLILLNSGTKDWDEIKRTLKVTSTGILPQIKILEVEHLIQRDGKKFSLTPMGKVLASHLEPLVKTMDVFDKNKKFWQDHNLGVFPHEILLEIKDLGNYQILENPDEELFDINQFLRNIAQSKTVKGVSHTIHPKYPEFFMNLAKIGTASSIILTPGVYKVVKEKYPDHLKEYLKADKSEMFVSKNDLKFSFTVTDSYFSLSLFYNNGVFDSKRDVVSYDESARRWGDHLFAYFKDQSEKITRLD